MCRKLETEEEKVLPFYSSSLSAEEDEQVASVEAEPALETLAQVGSRIIIFYLHGLSKNWHGRGRNLEGLGRRYQGRTSYTFQYLRYSSCGIVGSIYHHQ